MEWEIRFDLQLFAADDDGGEGSPNAGGDTNTGGGDGDPNAGGGKITFTPEQQAHIDGLLAQRLARATKNAAKSALEARARELGFETVDAMEKALAEYKEAQERTKTDLQRAEEARAAAEARAQAAEQKAMAAEIGIAAQSQAIALGVKPERVNYAIKLADLTPDKVYAEGKLDQDAIKEALEAVLKDVPELKGVPGSVGGPSNPGGSSGNDPKIDMNHYIRRAAGRR